MAKRKKKSRRQRTRSLPEQKVDAFMREVGIRPMMNVDHFWKSLSRTYGTQAATFQASSNFRAVSEQTDTSEYQDTVDALYQVKNASLDFSIAISSQFTGGLHSNFLSFVASLDVDWKAKTILDLGCDNGILTAFYAKHLTDVAVLGVDRCSEAIDCANELKDRLKIPNLSFLNADAFQASVDPSLANNQWDFVFMSLCGYEELDRHRMSEQQIADRFYSYLKPDGAGFVVEYPNRPELLNVLAGGGQRHNYWSLSYQNFSGGKGEVTVLIVIRADGEP